jgi:exoribonuclease-2
MSTVYFPGGKITMLPESTIELFSLIEGCDRPAVSMYIELNAELEMLGMRTTIERVRVARNLRHDALDMNFNEQAVATGQVDLEYGEQLLLLLRFANMLEVRRGKKDGSVDRVDYSFFVDNDRVRIVPRKRGSAIDKLVSELMIFVNGEWGRQLTEAKLAALYRTQTGGKVRMSTVAAPHEGLGLGQYIWASSPLRRYADLVNQRQLLTMVRGTSPAYAANGEQLFEIMRGFELAYDAYAEQQRLMERYWCLRWLLQTDATDVQGRVIRDDLVRIDGIPLVSRIQSLPQLARGECVQLRISDIDLFELSLRGEYQRTLSAET